MASGSKLNQALQLILEDLSETNCPDADIEATEAENAQLQQKKIRLMAELNHNTTVTSCVVLLNDMLTRQKNHNQTRFELKQQAEIQFKDRSQEAVGRVDCWKQKLQEVDNLMTLPYKEVLEKVLEMDELIADNRLKINELIKEQATLSRNLQGSNDIINLSETLKLIEKEQRKQLRKLTEDTCDRGEYER